MSNTGFKPFTRCCRLKEWKMKSPKKIEEILREHKGDLAEKYQVKEIGLFGFFVRGEQGKRSDVDILVEFEEVPDLFKFIELEIHLEGILGLKVDLIRKEALRKELKDRILSEVVNI
jgi:predicted nucleotidyltransferase